MNSALRTEFRPREVVVIEDSPTDAGMILRTLKRNSPSVHLTLLTNGEKASEHLDFCEEPPGLPLARPDLVIMDLNLPKKGGLEVLRELRRLAAYEEVPVAVLTGSENAEDWSDAYGAGANCVAVKPVRSEDFAALVWSMARFCLVTARARHGPS